MRKNVQNIIIPVVFKDLNEQGYTEFIVFSLPKYLLLFILFYSKHNVTLSLGDFFSLYSLNFYLLYFYFGSLFFKKRMALLDAGDVDLKQMDCKIFLQQRWAYLVSAENCSLGSATMVSHVQVPAWQGKENTFKGRKRKREAYSKQRVHGFSPTEFFPGKKRSLLPLGLCC